ncbi:hypothetical protein C1N53_01190 [Pontibacter sp. SGAir0037]|nr:hypothetical protein C1N53_01190 [Pontibacter sp. SGAir0037]
MKIYCRHRNSQPGNNSVAWLAITVPGIEHFIPPHTSIHFCPATYKTIEYSLLPTTYLFYLLQETGRKRGV